MNKIYEILGKIPGKWIIVVAVIMGIIFFGLLFRGFYLGIY
mgnify:FL=1